MAIREEGHSRGSLTHLHAFQRKREAQEETQHAPTPQGRKGRFYKKLNALSYLDNKRGCSRDNSVPGREEKRLRGKSTGFFEEVTRKFIILS